MWVIFLHSEPAELQRPADGESTVAAARAHALPGAVPGTQSNKLLSGKIYGICRMGKFEKLVGLHGEKISVSVHIVVNEQSEIKYYNMTSFDLKIRQFLCEVSLFKNWVCLTKKVRQFSRSRNQPQLITTILLGARRESPWLLILSFWSKVLGTW